MSVSATSANFIDKNAGSGKVVNASGLTLGGTDAGNYNLTAITGTGTGTISQAQIASVSGITAAGKTYDATDTATVCNAGATFAGMVNGDSLNQRDLGQLHRQERRQRQGCQCQRPDPGRHRPASNYTVSIHRLTGDIAKATITA